MTSCDNRLLKAAQGPWQQCRVGIPADEKSEPPRTWGQEVARDEEGLRVSVVDSDERKQYEQAQREKAMETVREELEALAQRVVAGKLKAPQKAVTAAARILGRHDGSRYFAWEYPEASFATSSTP